jgi:hypothetical protein
MINFNWLTKRVTVEEAEANRMIDYLGIDEATVVDKGSHWKESLLQGRPDWEAFKQKLTPDLELWEWSSPSYAKFRVYGYALVANGVLIVDHMIAAQS